MHEQKKPNHLSSSPFAPRFLLENFYLDKHVRYVVAIYPVVILWLSGTLSNSDSPEGEVYIFAGIVRHHTPVRTFNFSVHCLLIYILCIFNLLFLLQLRSWLFPPLCLWHALPWSHGGITNSRFTMADPVCHQWK